jgi:hypothetical protein
VLPITHHTKDAQGRARIVAYAKWDLAMPDERGARFPPWHGDMPHSCAPGVSGNRCCMPGSLNTVNHSSVMAGRSSIYQKYVKVVDPDTKDAQGRARIVAYAKWDLAMPDEAGKRLVVEDPTYSSASDHPSHACALSPAPQRKHHTKPYQKYVKVVDPDTKDAQGRARIVAYAKWDLAITVVLPITHHTPARSLQPPKESITILSRHVPVPRVPTCSQSPIKNTSRSSTPTRKTRKGAHG